MAVKISEDKVGTVPVTKHVSCDHPLFAFIAPWDGLDFNLLLEGHLKHQFAERKFFSL